MRLLAPLFGQRTPENRVRVLHDSAVTELRQAEFEVVQARDNLLSATRSLEYCKERVALLASEIQNLQAVALPPHDEPENSGSEPLLS